MGDIWPYGGPDRVGQAAAQGAATAAGFGIGFGITMGAIAMAESGTDIHVINDTPLTGDYSVGAWQINYYGGLYISRAAAYGTPAQLIAGGIAAQARAALGIWKSQGFEAWSTYKNGAYLAYMPGGRAGSPGGAPTQLVQAVDVSIAPPTEDYSATVHQHGNQLTYVAGAFSAVTLALAGMRDSNPNG